MNLINALFFKKDMVILALKLLVAIVTFIYFEKATKFCEISTLDLTVTTQDKSKVEISPDQTKVLLL